jgi:hypothetical protein
VHVKDRQKARVRAASLIAFPLAVLTFFAAMTLYAYLGEPILVPVFLAAFLAAGATGIVLLGFSTTTAPSAPRAPLLGNVRWYAWGFPRALLCGDLAAAVFREAGWHSAFTALFKVLYAVLLFVPTLAVAVGLYSMLRPA